MPVDGLEEFTEFTRQPSFEDAYLTTNTDLEYTIGYTGTAFISTAIPANTLTYATYDTTNITVDQTNYVIDELSKQVTDLQEELREFKRFIELPLQPILSAESNDEMEAGMPIEDFLGSNDL